METYKIGSRHQIHTGNSCHTATVIYNNSSIAIAGFNYSITRKDSFDNHWEHSPFAMRKEEIEPFVPNFTEDDTYNAFAVIDLGNWRLIEIRDWLRRNDALFILGERYHSSEEWDDCFENSMTVYRNNGVAIIKMFDGEGHVYDAYKKNGYSSEEILSAFQEFEDNYPADNKEHFYLCVRECNDDWIDLQGNTINDNIYRWI